MNKVSVRELDNLEGKRVFLRVDFNVPLGDNREILNDNKIKASLPTIQFLLDHKALLIVASHLGRPKGQIKEELRMDSVARRLSDLLGRNVIKTDECIGEGPQRVLDKMKNGDILLLENVRFHPGEEKNDPELARQFAKMADIYVNDAFGTMHRAHASTVGIAKYLPAVAGLLTEKEIQYLEKSINSPEHPMLAILGGKKVADKITVIENFFNKVDALLVGGAMANTFLKACGYKLGKSLYEPDKLELAKKLLFRAAERGITFLLPVDLVVARDITEGDSSKIVPVEEVPEGWQALDIGPETVEAFTSIIKEARMIVWNGPLGAFEYQPFHKGTQKIAQAIIDSGAISIVGGGDIVAALEKVGVADRMSHVSTGGGAVLKFWEGCKLPGITVLQERG